MYYIFLAEGFEEIEAITVIDTLRRGSIPIESVSITDHHEVMGAHGIEIKADRLISEIISLTPDGIILPGGMPGTRNLEACEPLLTYIDYHSPKILNAAICAAPMILGEMGLLKGRKAVCYPGFESHLKGAFVQGGPVAVDENFVTSKGPGTALDFALKLVEIIKTKEEANRLKQQMIK